MQQAFVIRPKSTSFTKTIQKPIQKEPEHEVLTRNTISESQTSIIDRQRQTVRTSTSSTANTVTNFRKQFEEVQQIVTRVEEALQNKQEETVRSSWKVSELQNQVEYLLHTTEELAQSNAADAAFISWLQEDYENVKLAWEEYRKQILNPLNEIIDFRNSLIREGNAAIEKSDSVHDILAGMRIENQNLIKNITETEGNIVEIMKEQELLQNEVVRADNFIVAKIEEELAIRETLRERLRFLNEEKLRSEEVRNMAVNDMLSIVADAEDVFDATNQLNKILDDAEVELRIMEHDFDVSLRNFQNRKRLMIEREQFHQAEIESKDYEFKIEEVLLRKEIISLQIQKTRLKQELAERELKITETDQFIKQISIHSEILIGARRDMEKLLRIPDQPSKIQESTEQLKHQFQTLQAILEQEKKRLNEKESQAKEALEQLAMIKEECLMKQAMVLEIEKLLQQDELNNMNHEDFLSNQVESAEKELQWNQNCMMKEEFEQHRILVIEASRKFEQSLSSALRRDKEIEIQLLSLQEGENRLQEREMETQEEYLMFKEDWKILESEINIQIKDKVAQLEAQCEAEQSEIRHLIEMLSGPPPIDLHKAVREEIEALEIEVARLTAELLEMNQGKLEEEVQENTCADRIYSEISESKKSSALELKSDSGSDRSVEEWFQHDINA